MSEYRCPNCNGVLQGQLSGTADFLCKCFKESEAGLETPNMDMEDVVEDFKKRHPEGIKTLEFTIPEDVKVVKDFKTVGISIAAPLSEQIRNEIGRPDEIPELFTWAQRAQAMEEEIKQLKKTSYTKNYCSECGEESLEDDWCSNEACKNYLGK